MRSHSSLPTMRILALLLCLPALVAWSSGVLRPATTATATKAASMRMAVHGTFHVTKKPLLPQRFSPPRAAAASAVPEQEAGGVLGRLRAKLPPTNELKKIVPLAIMFFCILFNYTILRDTKDVLVVTAPGSSAEAIPFLKTWVNLPGAIGFTVLYSAMANRLGRQALFYSVLGPFLAFFGAFPLIYQLRGALHPVGLATWLAARLPAGFAAPIAVLRNWTYSLFYLLANMWGSVVVSLLFWGTANDVVTVPEAKKYFPLFGLFANVALVFSGQFVRYVSSLHATLPAGVDAWGVALKLLMSSVVALGAVVAGCYRYLNVAVIEPQEAAAKAAGEALTGGGLKLKKKKKASMTMGESARYLASSPYIRNLATLVIAYGMSINLVEVTWKAKLKAAFPNPTDYSAFMGSFSSATGVVTLFMMLFGRFVFRKWGWGTAAMITPAVLLATGVAFFALCLTGSTFAAPLAALGTTPLMLAVFVGAAQNIMSKAAKYSLFDPCKEMAYIPLDHEQKTKGKAAVDVIGGPLGKSGGSLIQQLLIVSFGSLAASTPYLAAILGVIIVAWMGAAGGLAVQFEEKMLEMDAANAAADAAAAAAPPPLEVVTTSGDDKKDDGLFDRAVNTLPLPVDDGLASTNDGAKEVK
eukprot:Transcript_30117.p1 GENE.Transcript_30117~~Transcript_30117.p1  ORF type:complete len:640 (-),score=333.96 Transcript_30117:225-2144(-)